MRFSVSPFSLPAAPRQAVAVSVSGKRGPQGSHCQGFGQASFASSAPAQCFFFTAFRFGRLFSFQKYPDMVPACFGGRLADSFLLVVFSSKIPAFSLESEAECVISYTNLLILSLKHYHPILWTRILLLPGDAFRFSFKWCCKSKSCTHITEKSRLGPILHPEKNVCEMLSGVFEESLSFPSTTLSEHWTSCSVWAPGCTLYFPRPAKCLVMVAYKAKRPRSAQKLLQISDHWKPLLVSLLKFLVSTWHLPAQLFISHLSDTVRYLWQTQDISSK